MKHAILIFLIAFLTGGAGLLAQRKGTTPVPAGIPAPPPIKTDTLYTETKEEDDGQPPPNVLAGYVFRDAIGGVFTYQTAGGRGSGFGGGTEFHHYFSGRARNDDHRSLLNEVVGQPTSSIDFSLTYAPNSVVELENHGYLITVSAVTMMGSDMAIGGSGRYGRTKSDSSNIEVPDYELGPRFAFWPTDRVYFEDQLLYRHIGGYSDAGQGSRVSDEEYFMLRHHLVYVASEHRDFTYAQDMEARVGIHQNFHVNNFTMLNSFLFSTSGIFSFGPVAGFSLDYTLGSRTSVLNIPLRARAEFIIDAGRGAIQTEIGYNLPTMPGQDNGELQAQGGIAYRF